MDVESMQTLLGQLATLVQVMATNQAAQVPIDRGRKKKQIDTRHVRLPTFSGNQNDYDDWAFAFRCAR
jgi:hypothetical protein